MHKTYMIFNVTRLIDSVSIKDIKPLKQNLANNIRLFNDIIIFLLRFLLIPNIIER